MQNGRHALTGAGGLQVHIEQSNTEQAQTDHQHAGNRAALERNVKRFVHAFGCSLGGTHVSADRDVHSNKTASARKHCTNHETNRGRLIQKNRNQYSQHYADNTDRFVLPRQVSASALLDRCCDFHHLGIARTLVQNPGPHYKAIYDCEYSAAQGKIEAQRNVAHALKLLKSLLFNTCYSGKDISLPSTKKNAIRSIPQIRTERESLFIC